MRSMASKRTYRFPGMDPWLEHPVEWPGIHDPLITHMADELNRTLAPRYFARSAHRTVLEIPEWGIKPDVAVLARAKRVREGTRSYVAGDPPVTVAVEPIEVEETFIEVRAAQLGRKVIAVIEILSRSNKRPGSDSRKKYLKKQAEVLASNIHLVEIDLLRWGAHTVAVPEERLEELDEHDYRVVVRRADRRSCADIYPVHLRERLPRISVPLLKPDPDAVVDLQALVEGVYESGRYGDDLEYDRPPVPPLEPKDMEWARGVLKGRGKNGRR